MARVICLGIAVLDRIYEVEEIPSEPIKVTALGYRETGGGMAATAAVAAAALGGDVAYWGRLGEDGVGDRIAAELARHGVDLSGVRRFPTGRSPTAAALVDAAGERLLAAFPGSGLEDDPSWLPLARLAKVDAVLADCRWTAGGLALFRAAGERGVPSILDADLVPRSGLEPMVAVAGHVLFSTRGLRQYTGEPDIRAGLRKVASETSAVLGVTLGADGVLWLDEGHERHAPGLPVAARDTTGAGDVFHGAYALAIAEGRGPAEAIRFANIAAGIKCARGNGWAGMPDRESVEAQMKERTDAAFGW